MSLRVYFLMLPAWVCICGCAEWETPEIPARSIFPESRIAPDAVGMEVALAQLDSQQKDDFELFWNQLDQQALPIELRKRLDPDAAAERVYNFLHTLAIECQMLARACGKTNVHSLEPEDLAALTMEASALAQVPLAGSQHTVGRPDLTRF